MIILTRLKRQLWRHMARLSWLSILLLMLGYVLLSGLLLAIAGETALIESPVTLLYLLLVTGSTVGYGDFSPVTDAGRLAFVLFVIPAGIGIFTLILGRLGSALFNLLRRRVTGMRTTQSRDHILVIGWRGARTRRLVSLLMDESESNARRIVLAVTREGVENPFPEVPDRFELVRVASFSNPEDLAAANVAAAATIVIDTPDDDVTLATGLLCARENPGARLIAHFKDESLADLFHSHCAQAECIPSVDVEMVAKTSLDPGSSELHHELLAASQGQTQYSLVVPQVPSNLSVRALRRYLDDQHQALLIGIQPQSRGKPILNPAGARGLEAGDRLYYIADDRIEEACIDWRQLASGASTT